MKKLLPFTVSILFAFNAFGQDSMEKTIEGRAREMHRVLGLTDNEEYKKFMQDNYSKAFLEKPIKLNRVVSDSDGEVSSTKKDQPLSTLEAKAQMYQQLHNDFGGSKIISITRKENKIEMVLRSDSGLTGTFTFTFEKNKPYLIEAIGIQAEMEN